jgi:hypothetical protein
VPGELSDQGTGGAADHRRSQQRGREQAHDQADPAADRHPLAPEVVTGLVDGDLPAGVVGDQGHALHGELLVPDQPDEGVEVLLGQVRDEVGRDDDVEVGVAH